MITRRSYSGFVAWWQDEDGTSRVSADFPTPEQAEEWACKQLWQHPSRIYIVLGGRVQLSMKRGDDYTEE